MEIIEVFSGSSCTKPLALLTSLKSCYDILWSRDSIPLEKLFAWQLYNIFSPNFFETKPKSRVQPQKPNLDFNVVLNYNRASGV
jgi:hypothetical protein